MSPPSPSRPLSFSRRSSHFRGEESVSADVGSRTRSSSRRRAARSAFGVARPSSLAPRSRRPAPPRRARLARPASPASSVRRRPAPRLALSPRSRRAQAQRPELAPCLRTSSLGLHGHREQSVAAARGGRRTSERARPRGGRGRWLASRRWSPSSGSVWPTRNTARTSPSAATSPRPR